MLKEQHFTIKGDHGKPILIDVSFKKTHQPKPIVIFCHGYKGFKDWGPWNLVAQEFAENEFFFIKFNFSHHGTTPENPMEFVDLDTFSKDNFSKQLDDLQKVMDWILTTKRFVSEADVQHLNLIGHSRGGAIALIKAAESNHIKKISTWAGVSGLARAFPKGDKLDQWKKEKIRYVENMRTHQMMPHHIQFYEDYIKNEERFDLKRVSRQIRIPYLIVQAQDDPVVKTEDAKKLHKMNSKSELFLIPSGGHTFGGKHPWENENLPDSLKKATEKTIDFFKIRFNSRL